MQRRHKNIQTTCSLNQVKSSSIPLSLISTLHERFSGRPYDNNLDDLVEIRQVLYFFHVSWERTGILGLGHCFEGYAGGWLTSFSYLYNGQSISNTCSSADEVGDIRSHVTGSHKILIRIFQTLSNYLQ